MVLPVYTEAENRCLFSKQLRICGKREFGQQWTTKLFLGAIGIGRLISESRGLIKQMSVKVLDRTGEYVKSMSVCLWRVRNNEFPL